ncbi:hypothetical protein BpHYR1_013380 [Brachionus plicatilis]|uniref:Uncharacterized protein n=1 Tax=Brachionus plicatilis TaxID=10195 RepID=A0A3M7SMF9_BRAPC|nr:hypothetical protein BpHYR1_013380 [Brachionus plicatilis]
MTGISRIAVVVGLGINCCAYAQGFTNSLYKLLKSTPKNKDIILTNALNFDGIPKATDHAVNFEPNSDSALYDLMLSNTDSSILSNHLKHEPDRIKFEIYPSNKKWNQIVDSGFHVFKFVPAFYAQPKIIDLNKNSNSNLIEKKSSLDFDEFFQILKINDGKLYVQILEIQTQQVEQIPIRLFKEDFEQKLSKKGEKQLGRCSVLLITIYRGIITTNKISFRVLKQVNSLLKFWVVNKISLQKTLQFYAFCTPLKKLSDILEETKIVCTPAGYYSMTNSPIESYRFVSIYSIYYRLNCYKVELNKEIEFYEGPKHVLQFAATDTSFVAPIY